MPERKDCVENHVFVASSSLLSIAENSEEEDKHLYVETAHDVPDY